MFNHRTSIMDALKKHPILKEAEIELISYFGLAITMNNNTKFLIFEPSAVYTKIDEQINLLTTISDAECSPSNSYRIPYFAGLSGSDLGYFLLGPDQVIDNLNIKINFDILPVDFNLSGIRRFLNYLNMLDSQIPIFKSNNNISLYIEYFVGLIEDNDFKINTILPLMFKDMFPSGEILQKIFDEVKVRQEKYEMIGKDYNDNRKK